MRIIDQNKIAPFTEMISEEVTKECLLREVSRPQAYAWILRNLGFFMRLEFGDDGWVSGCAIPLSIQDGSPISPQELGVYHIPYFEDSLAAQLLEHISKTAVFGPSPEVVVTALVLLALDESADVFVDLGDAEHRDISPGWWEVGAMRPFDARHLDDADQMYLFESESEFRERRIRMIEFRSRQRLARFMDMMICQRRFERRSKLQSRADDLPNTCEQ